MYNPPLQLLEGQLMGSAAPPKAILRTSCPHMGSYRAARELFLPLSVYPSSSFRLRQVCVHAKKRNSRAEPVLKPEIVQEVASVDEEEDDEGDPLLDEFDDDDFEGDEDDGFKDLFLEDDTELYEKVGDGAGGGGISLAGTWWDREALAIAEEVCHSLDGDLGIYAFKTLSNSTIRVRIEKLSTKSSSPTIEDIEAFSTSYRTRLDEAEVAQSVPENLYLEVSSPGVERAVRVPYDFDRFKERSMFVRYTSETSEGESSSENDGIFRLISFDMESRSCTWGLADVKANREKAGKGRPLNKKQREWRLTTSFDSLRLVRLHSEA